MKTAFRRLSLLAALTVLGVTTLVAAPLKFQGADGGTTTTYTAPDGSIFRLISDNISTGTGVFPSFLRVTSPGNSTVEQGYNTESGPPQVYDETIGQTRNVLWSDLGTWNEGGTDYYLLLLDWNEPNNDRQNDLALLDLRIYSGIPNLDSQINQSGFTDNTTELWTLAGSLGNSGYDQMWFVDTNSGSGRGDFGILIPKSLITIPNGEPNFILYTKMGNVDNFGAAQGTFEEFSYYAGGTVPPNEVPEPSTWALLGAGLIGLAAIRRRK
jgi:hypothetical protein